MANYEDVDVRQFDAPIPGESLTSSPESPWPWEKPPQYTDEEEAKEVVFKKLMEPQTMSRVVDLMSEGVPVADIAQIMVFAGFQQGAWNPDMMLTMIEPVMYTLLFLAEQTGLDPVIKRDEMEGTPEMEDVQEMIDTMPQEEEGLAAPMSRG